MDMGSAATDTATLTFTFDGTTSTIRTWELKATQIPCSSPSRPDLGCLQYHTTLAGRFQTFNYADSTNMQHLASQKYEFSNIYHFIVLVAKAGLEWQHNFRPLNLLAYNVAVP